LTGRDNGKDDDAKAGAAEKEGKGLPAGKRLSQCNMPIT